MRPPAKSKRKSRGPSRVRLGPFLLGFLAGGLTVSLLLGGGMLLGPARQPDPGGGEANADLEGRADALSALLLPQADWQRRGDDLPLDWFGELPASESLVQWNARVSAGIQGLGLEVLDGQEEILHRPGKWPLERLTLIVGCAGEVLATIVVEIARSPSVPPPF